MNLTINEQLMKDTQDANICIFIANLASWLRTNSSKLHLPLEQRNFREGRYWSYNSIEGFVQFFGFWSTRNIRTIIKNCIDQGLIITNTFNKKKYDNTLWYTLTDKGLSYYPHLAGIFLNTLVDSDKQLVETDKPIPKPLTTGNNINIITSDSDESQVNSNDEIIKAYHGILPNNPKIKVLDDQLKRQLNKMKKNWPKYQKDGKKFSIESFKDYLKYLKYHHPWFVNPYAKDNGKKGQNSLRHLTRDINMAKVVNGEFNG